MASIFTKIIAGDIPCFKIAEDEKHIAFLDINPLAMGHTLVVPKREVDYIYDLNPQELAELHVFAQHIALALDEVCDCKRVGVLVIGTEVPHAHIHLIPFQEERQMAITSERLFFNKDEMTALASRVADKVTLIP